MHTVMYRFLLLALVAILPASQVLGEAALRTGDSLTLRISGVPGADSAQISASYSIDAEGNISLPYIGKIRAVGFTTGQLQTIVANRYKSERIFTNPTINITSGGGRFINVAGEVKSPGRKSYTPDLTLLRVIIASGDFSDYANERKVQLSRDGEVMEVDVKKIRQNPNLDIPLKPGDDIYVPQSWF